MPLTTDTKSFFDNFLKTEVKQANDTKTLRDHRKEFEARLLHTTPTSEIAAKIEAAHQVVWIPEAYVLFKRHATCRNCGNKHECLDTPRLFLQQRKLKRDEQNSKMYTPVKEIEHTSLPWLIQIAPITVPFCLSCFEKPKWQKSHLDPLLQENISSQIAPVESSSKPSSPIEAALASSNSTENSSSPAVTSETEFAGSPSEKVCGLGSERNPQELPAVVNG